MFTSLSIVPTSEIRKVCGTVLQSSFFNIVIRPLHRHLDPSTLYDVLWMECCLCSQSWCLLAAIIVGQAPFPIVHQSLLWAWWWNILFISWWNTRHIFWNGSFFLWHWHEFQSDRWQACTRLIQSTESQVSTPSQAPHRIWQEDMWSQYHLLFGHLLTQNVKMAWCIRLFSLRYCHWLGRIQQACQSDWFSCWLARSRTAVGFFFQNLDLLLIYREILRM